ncbi:hypothetical protein KKP04_14740 [Rhodomicrobium sp. Az07]|uniref:hypothetical protein n=1 Tax=Rhodomicrobium sp. Az07 TaxID=2839034 RepID=UPI001BEABD65|nr:hypothetical protein [Rhodomicrobium sp. Az07]MBT3072110.1 hypothetical protein [Rhodomicrobium sp. Az07]
MMNENDTGEREASAPVPQTPSHNDDTGLVLKTDTNKTSTDGADDPEQTPSSDPTYDEARFAAGVVKLYEKLLAEPIPEEMLALINKIEKQERD